MKLLAPSILSANFWNLQNDILASIEGGADIIHFDVMDGHFVPNITVGPYVLECIRKHIDIPIDAHLMIENPDFYIKDFVDAGANYISIHIENVRHIHRSIELIKSLGAKAGVAINPGSSLKLLEEIIYYADFILLMSVNPGFGGQSFIERSTDRLKLLKGMIEDKNPNCLIEIDGGIKENNIKEVSEAGANIFVVGSGIFGKKDIKEQTKLLKTLIGRSL